MLNWLNNKYNQLWLGISFLILLNLTIFLLWKAPANVGNACVIGGSLSVWNIVFAFLMSLALSLNLVGLVEILKRKKVKNNVSVSALGGVGFGLWFLSTVCLACYIPLVTLFGISFSLNFLTVFTGWAQYVGLAVALVGIYFVDRQIRYGCLVGENCEL
jgi:hypothetical protein